MARTFRSIVSVSTGLGLAVMAAALAALVPGTASAFTFHWSWAIVPWMIAAILANQQFWKITWLAQDNPSPRIKRKVRIYLFAASVLGVAAFLYPIRFAASDHLKDILRGLATAAVFLGALGAIIFQLVKGLARDERTQIADQE